MASTCAASLPASLLRSAAYVGGSWVHSSDSATFPVLDPATGAELVQVADCGPRECREAVQTAAEAFQSWKEVSSKVRMRCDWPGIAIDHIVIASSMEVSLFRWLLSSVSLQEAISFLFGYCDNKDH